MGTLRLAHTQADLEGTGLLSYADFKEILKSSDLGLTRKDINLISAQVCVRVGVCVCVCECVCLWPGADSQWYQPDTCTGTCMFMRVCVCICIPITVRFNQCLQGRWNLAACGFSFLLSVLTVITDAIRLQGSASKAAIKNGRKQRRQAKQNRPF